MSMAGSVRPLSVDVIKRLRTGINLTSVAHCVEELVLNSIDAGATCIAVHLNLPVYQIQVIDNGDGIDAEQMKIVGHRYATSKCHSLEDLKNLKSGGFRGEALASLKEVSNILMIESRSSKSQETYCKIFSQGAALDPKKSLSARPSKGTTVSVYDFMYNMPVRRNSFSAMLDLEDCRKVVQGIALMNPNVSFSLKNEATGENILQLRKSTSLRRSFLQIFGKRKVENLKEVSFRRDCYEICGCISVECVASKDLQFLFVNKRLVLHTRLHKLINSVLNKALSSRNRTKKLTPDGCSPTKNQAQCCVFVLNISCAYDKYDIVLEPRKTMIEFSEWDEVTKLVEDCLTDFLKRENLPCAPEEKSTIPHGDTQTMVGDYRFDTHDYRQGLFSHAARRLQKDHVNVANNEKQVNDISEHFSTETLKTIVDNPSLVCLSNNEASSSILDELKGVSSKDAVPDSFMSVPSPDVSDKNSNILCKSVFPTKNPIVLNMPVKSTLSELQSGSSSLDLLSKLKEKFRFSPLKRSTLVLNSKKPSFESFRVKANATSGLRSCLQASKRCQNLSNASRNISSPLDIGNVVKPTKDKSVNCPSISIDIQSSRKNMQKESNVTAVKDQSSQCPSVTLNSGKRIVSRFNFRSEGSAMPFGKSLKRTKKKSIHSSKNLIQDCVDVVKVLLDDTASNIDSSCTNMNDSFFSCDEFFQPGKNVCFESQEFIGNSVSSFGNIESHFNDVTSDSSCTETQYLLSSRKSACKNPLQPYINDGFNSSPFFLKPFCDYRTKVNTASAKYFDFNTSSHSKIRDSPSSFGSEQSSFDMLDHLISFPPFTSLPDGEKQRSTFIAESKVPCTGKTQEFEPHKGSDSYKSDAIEIISSLSTAENDSPGDKICHKKYFPFKNGEIVSQNLNKNQTLSCGSIVESGGSKELESLGAENLSALEDSHPMNFNNCFSQSNQNILDEVYDIIHELLNDVVLVKPIASYPSILNDFRHDKMKIHDSSVTKNSIQNTISETARIKSREPAHFLSSEPENSLPSLEKKNTSNKNSCELFVDSCSEFSEAVESLDSGEILSSNLKEAVSDNHPITTKANNGACSTDLKTRAVDTDSSTSFTKFLESKEKENDLNIEADDGSLDVAFSELAGMENRSNDNIGKETVNPPNVIGYDHALPLSKAQSFYTLSKDVTKSQTFGATASCCIINDKVAETENVRQVNENYWQTHLDPISKRTVYIDPKTGNSSYIPSLAAENSADNLSALQGGPQKSHFFLSHDFSPFMTKTQTPNSKRVCAQLKNSFQKFVRNNVNQEQDKKWRMFDGQLEDDSDSEFQNLLNKWENPIFEIPYEVSGVGDSKTMQSLPQMYTFLNSYKFSSNSLKSLEVIGQVDCKFIACVLKNFKKGSQEKLLALFDQHAVHERVRLEELLEDLYEPSSIYAKSVKSESVSPALRISLDCEEIRLLQTYCEDLHRIGIKLKIDDCQSCSVYSVPACLLHKRTKDLRRSQADTIIILQNSVSEWLSSIVKTRSIPQILPKTLASVVNYQACRGAVKFGDPLTSDQCVSLLEALSKCKLPFQCAHGRPSIAPILDLRKLEPLLKKILAAASMLETWYFCIWVLLGAAYMLASQLVNLIKKVSVQAGSTGRFTINTQKIILKNSHRWTSSYMQRFEIADFDRSLFYD